MDTGSVIRDMAGVIRRHLAPILLISLTIQTISLLLDLGAAALAPAHATWMGSSGYSVLSGLVSLVVEAAGFGAITVIVTRDARGVPIEAAQAIAIGIRLALPVTGLLLVTLIGVGLGAILFLVPGLMLYLRWLVAVQCRVVEGGTLSAALQRSAVLTAGSRWRLLLLVLIQASIVLALYALQRMVLPQGSTAAGVPEPHGLLQSAVTVLDGVVNSVISTVGSAVCYVHLAWLHDTANRAPDAAGA